MRFVEKINFILNSILKSDSSIAIFGEDIVDPYGGAFKATVGLSTIYKSQVIATPISEAGFTGVAVGRALSGRPTIVEYMFGDFALLACDQIINQAAKFSTMYGRKLPLPIMFRVPCGGGRGYGATHSQSVEKIFCGHPGLTVFTVNEYTENLEEVYNVFRNNNEPVVVIENKISYTKAMQCIEQPTLFNDVLIVCHGSNTEKCIQVSSILIDKGYRSAVININKISPLSFSEEQIRLILNAKKIILVSEEPQGYGINEEVSSQLLKFGLNEKTIRYVNSSNCAIPASRALEEQALVTVEKIISTLV